MTIIYEYHALFLKSLNSWKKVESTVIIIFYNNIESNRRMIIDILAMIGKL